MKIKVSEATNTQLDQLVAKCEGRHKLAPLWVDDDRYGNHVERPYSPTTDWAQGGPILDREGLSLAYWGEHSKFGQHERMEQFWEARHPSHRTHSRRTVGYGPTPLIAAMRCFVTSKLGEEVEVPDEL